MSHRVTQATKLLNWLKHAPPETVRISPDEKLWTVDQTHYSRLDWVIAVAPEDVPSVLMSKHPTSSMQMGIVTSDTRKLPLWLGQGQKVSAKVFIHSSMW